MQNLRACGAVKPLNTPIPPIPLYRPQIPRHSFPSPSLSVLSHALRSACSAAHAFLSLSSSPYARDACSKNRSWRSDSIACSRTIGINSAQIFSQCLQFPVALRAVNLLFYASADSSQADAFWSLVGYVTVRCHREVRRIVTRQSDTALSHGQVTPACHTSRRLGERQNAIDIHPPIEPAPMNGSQQSR